MAKFPIEENVPFQFPAGLRVLAVDDDHTILEFIKQMCFQCHYCAITFSNAPLALNYVREKNGCIDIILIEVHTPNMNGYEFLQQVTKETNVPVIMMSHDHATSAVMKAITYGACDYWIKPLHENQFKIMWKHVARKLARSETKLPNKVNVEFGSLVIDAIVKDPKNNRFNFKESDVNESNKCYAPPTKKPRLVWSPELHIQFVKALMQIGFNEAQPKKILEVMNIPGLTKDHVASHLQKYRLQLKRYNGVTLQQNKIPLSNTIEFRGREGVHGRFDLTTFGASTSYVPYAAVNPEELTSNLIKKQYQWPNHSHAELQAVAYGHSIAKCPYCQCQEYCTVHHDSSGCI